MKALLLAGLLALMPAAALAAGEVVDKLPAPIHATIIVEDEPLPIEGLYKIDGKGKDRKFYYKIAGQDRYLVLNKKLKHVPDLRPYDEQHPKWRKVQLGFEHWNPVLQGGAYSAGSWAAARVRLIKP